MVKLEDIARDIRLAGLCGAQGATVVQVQRHGTECATVTYRSDAGALGERVLYRDDEPALELLQDTAWTFSAEAEDFKLASEARRMQLAHLFDPYLALRTSKVQPLPHQILAVYQEMLPRLPLRYVLADDPGAGKTIMCGLLIKEMMARGDLERCLVVCPGSLCEQWQDELLEKFDIEFSILTNDLLEAAATRNAFAQERLLIARLDKLARDEHAQELLAQTRWDLIVVDEAHKMSASFTGGEVKATKRYRLGQLLDTLTENLLLLTATPHNGKPADFDLFMALVDEDRFAGVRASRVRAQGREPDVSDCMRRLVKEELLTFEGTPLFPERRAVTVNYRLSAAEAALYDEVTAYVRTEFNRADALDGQRRQSVGFALTMLQRRLASSPEAIYRSLVRRRARLAERLDEARRSTAAALRAPAPGTPWGAASPGDPFDEDDLPWGEAEGLVDDVTDTATAARTAAELEAEIARLDELAARADAVRQSNVDRKWEELSRLLQDAQQMFGEHGREKLIIFTEHKDTLRYLEAKIASLLGSHEAVLTIQGGMGRDARRGAEQRFCTDPEARILICTDAAGEGINLQRAHLMINYDLPWNPNRLEQRFGRIHRIGQTEVCWLWNLVAVSTREGAVWQRLFAKLEEERQALGGRVFDILGDVRFDNAPLKDLLLEAVRYGEDPQVRERLNQVVDESLDREALERLIDEKALTRDLLSARDVAGVRQDMDRAAARKLEPYHVQAFFVQGVRALGGRISEREPGRYEVLRLPRAVQDEERRITGGEPLKRCERVCFDRALESAPGRPPAAFLHPGHVLVRALAAAVEAELGGALEAGAVLVDECDAGTQARLLLCVETSVADAAPTLEGAPHVVSRELRFVEIGEDGAACAAGGAPYLDYRAPEPEELELVRAWMEGNPLTAGAEERARACALDELVPAHVARVRAERKPRLAHERRAVDRRLTDEVRYWEGRAWELEEQDRAGKEGARVNAANARARAEEFDARRRRRLEELDAREQIGALPPRIEGRALVVPQGLIAALAGAAPDPAEQAAARAVELAAMEAVMRIERRLGFEPRDVSAERGRGYDIESTPAAGLKGAGAGEVAAGGAAPTGGAVPGPAAGATPADTAPAPLRFIEVKGRRAGATEVTLTRNEGLCALNSADAFILAIVEVELDAQGTARARRASYLTRPLAAYDDAASKTTYTIASLRERAGSCIDFEEMEP